MTLPIKQFTLNKFELNFFKNKHILITGATGTLGKEFVKTFFNLNEKNKLNIKIIITSRNLEKAKKTFNNKVKIIKSDLSDLPTIKCDVIIHLASPLDFGKQKNPSDIISKQAQNIVNFANNNNVKNIIVASSGAVYVGNKCPKTGYTEATKLKAAVRKDYSHGKQSLEKIFLQYHSKTNCNMIIGRIFALSGANLSSGLAFPDFIRGYNNTGKITMNSDGSAIRTYCRTAECVMIMLLLLAKQDNEVIYNIGGTQKLSMMELAEKITGDKKLVFAKGKKTNNRNLYFPNMKKTLNALDNYGLSPIEDSILQVKDIKISVVIPTYNRKKYLKRAIDSVLSQTYKNIEICVTDNASNDGTEQLCKDYVKKHKIKYNRNNKNIGPANNISHGLYKMATGDYIMFMSDDDYLVDKKYITDAVEHIKQQQPAFIYGDYLVEKVSNNKVFETMKYQKPKGYSNKPYYNIPGNYVVKDFMGNFYPYININCFLMRRDYFKKYNSFIGTYMSVDQETKIKIALQGDGIFINRTVLHYTSHENNDTDSRDFSEHLRDGIDLIADIEPYLKKHYDNKNTKNIINKYRTKYLREAGYIYGMFGKAKTLSYIWQICPKNFNGIRRALYLSLYTIFGIIK